MSGVFIYNYVYVRSVHIQLLLCQECSYTITFMSGVFIYNYFYVRGVHIQLLLWPISDLPIILAVQYDVCTVSYPSKFGIISSNTAWDMAVDP
jgi:hypothetical protein